jgi:hypothetical protein
VSPYRVLVCTGRSALFTLLYGIDNGVRVCLYCICVEVWDVTVVTMVFLLYILVDLAKVVLSKEVVKHLSTGLEGSIGLPRSLEARWCSANAAESRDW